MLRKVTASAKDIISAMVTAEALAS